MNLNWLSFRDLDYVVKVAEHENFIRAAGHANVSQPALSLQIKKVETYLGFKIFERTKKRVFLTELGREFVVRARRVLAEGQNLVNLGDGETPFQTPFHLGAIRTSGPYLMPWFLPHFFKTYKSGKLLIREGLTDELIAALKNGDLDAVVASPTFDEVSLHRTDLFFEPFRLMFPKGHPLLAHKHLLGRDLDTSQMVLLEDGHCLKDQVVEICPASKRGGQRNFHATSLETLKQLVASGQGYTLFPELAIINKDKLDSLVAYRQVEGRVVGRTISLYTRQGSSRQKEADLVAQIIGKSVPAQVRVLKS